MRRVLFKRTPQVDLPSFAAHRYPTRLFAKGGSSEWKGKA
jgi:hypothetical protein